MGRRRGVLLGAHLSISGGYYRAVERAAELGCDTVQLFTRSNVQWRARPLTEEDCTLFRRALRRTGVRLPSAHANYLINLGSAERAKRERSIRALVDEVERCHRLGIGYLVLHPGAHQGDGERQGIARVARALDRVLRASAGLEVRILLENTAGQGTSLGYRFEHLKALLERCREPERLGICLDTCHLFAAGYPLAPQAAYERTMEEFDRTVGLRQVRVVHLNDSKKPLGSRVDRHEHIGEGKLGLTPFRLLLADRAFRGLPMYLETPKGVRNGVDMDLVNLNRLRRLVTDTVPRGRKPG